MILLRAQRQLSRISRRGALAGLAIGGLALFVISPTRADSGSPAADNTHTAPTTTSSAGGAVSFFTGKTRLWLGQSQILCFNAAGVDASHAFSFHADPKYLEVLMPPTVLPGQTIGYIRLRPLMSGQCAMRLDGASIMLDIVKEPEADTLWQTRPEIVCPAPGSAVWGTFAVGVEEINLGNSTPPPTPVLRLPDGRELTGQQVAATYPGPHARYVFTLDAQALPPGPNTLVAVTRNASGEELKSEPVDVLVARPDPAQILAGDCKDQIATPPPPPPPPDKPPVVPPVVTTATPAVVASVTPSTATTNTPSVPPPTASVATPPVVASAASPAVKPPDKPPAPFHPPALFPDALSGTGSVAKNQINLSVTVPKDGVYGLMMQVRGGVGGDALPTVAYVVDNPRVNHSQHMCRLATTDWQRVPVGAPISMTAGTHTLVVHMENGFGSGPQDQRDLYLARYELAPLETSAAGPALASNAGGSAMTMMQGGAETMTMQATSAGAGTPSGPEGFFNVYFADPIDGKTITGDVRINVRTQWSRSLQPLPPQVDLLINGHVAATIRHADPFFRVAASAFQPGENTLQVMAKLPDGRRAETAIENVRLPANADTGGEPYRPGYTFYPNDPAWDTSMGPRLDPKNLDSPATFYSNGQSSLALPGSLHGLYKISVEAHGTNFMGLPSVTLAISSGGQETPIGDVPTVGNGAEIAFPPANFPAGPKSLVLRYDSDHFVQGQGIRTLFVHAIRFDAQSAATAPAVAPTSSIAYPPDGTKVGFADAVVANVFAPSGTARADILIDGSPQHLDVVPPNGFGPLYLPLLTRGLTPGIHHVKIAVTDTAGGAVGQSPEVTVDVTGQPEVADGPYHRAVFLLNRFGYGPEPDQMAQILTQGPHAWLAAQLSEPAFSPREQNAEDMARAQAADLQAVVPRALQQLVSDPNPVRTRFVMWVENHFSTWIVKDGGPDKAREHQRFDDLGVAPFPTLLLASATSPAMLIYLDQRNSVTKRINENYAREIMELHTLGVKGGYTQKDVTTLADLLTGWTVTEQAPLDGSNGAERTFRYDPYLNTGTDCEVLGLDFPAVPPEKRFDRVLTALEMLAAHPSCAHFISRKLAEQYVADPAPPELVDHLSDVYLQTGGDMKAMLLSLLDEPAFWSAEPKVATPIDFGVRMERMSGLSSPGPLGDMIRRSGMGLFDRFSPDGYPEADGYYSNSNALLQRWRFAQMICNSYFNGGSLVPSQWRAPGTTWDAATTQRIIDFIAQRVIGDVLSRNSNDAAVQLVASAQPNTDRIRLLTLFVCQTPETNLR